MIRNFSCPSCRRRIVCYYYWILSISSSSEESDSNVCLLPDADENANIVLSMECGWLLHTNLEWSEMDSLFVVKPSLLPKKKKEVDNMIVKPCESKKTVACGKSIGKILSTVHDIILVPQASSGPSPDGLKGKKGELKKEQHR